MSRYPDERFENARSSGFPDLAAARSSVQLPAILLIAVGILSLIAAINGLVQLPEVPARMDEMIATIDADKNLPAEQKDAWKNILTAMKQAAEHPAAMAGYIVNILASLIVVVGGIKLLTLSGVTLPFTASVLAMIPCTVGCCCLLGFPVGIWSLIVLNRPHVRAAIDSRNSVPPADPDAAYMR